MISYTNQIKIVMDAVEKLIEDEFNIPVMDEHTGNESIVIMPEEDFLIENLSSGMLRSYNLDIVYTMSSGGGFERVKDHLTNRAERIKTLLFNNSSYSPSGTYKFHNGRVDSITYTRSEDDPDLWLATLSYSTMVMEAI
tara:strand:+ start:126 stop:542 length:417 start_codon:yes stop_codon:yes gene_type:complete